MSQTLDNLSGLLQRRGGAPLDRETLHEAERAPWTFACVALGLMLLSAVLVGWLPLQVSIATVFLFAGPHNWMELRFFVSRMPVRWGESRGFFLTALAGVALLTGFYASLPTLARLLGWEEAGWTTAQALWNCLLVCWVLALVRLRSRERGGRDWSWTLPVGFALVGLSWMSPQLWALGLVYLHPLVALWFLDRQIQKSRPRWRVAYRLCVACVPLCVAVLWWCLSSAPPLPADDALSLRITQHAGAQILSGVSSHLLVSTHVFLETLHYAVWLLAIPLVAMRRAAPWSTRRIPLVTHPRGWPRTVRTLLAASAFVVLLLWVAFVADYPSTRDLYFTVAMLHVLAEAPFLLRML